MQQGLSDEQRRVRFDKETLARVSSLVAVQGEEVLGAVYWQAEPNQTAQVWIPRCVPEAASKWEPDEVEAVSLALLEAADAQAIRAELDLAQAVLNDERFEQDKALLEKAGYRHLADLLYLASTPEMMPSSPPESPLEFEPYEETEYERLAGLVEATYQGTLDCPALNGVQSIDTVLDGYRKVGRFRPQHWRFIRHEGHDIGCLLLAEHPAQSLFELVYMGLVPDARGKGWGSDVACFAQWMTHAAGSSHLVVAVDAANTPAIHAYEQAGYISWDRRVVYVKVF